MYMGVPVVGGAGCVLYMGGPVYITRTGPVSPLISPLTAPLTSPLTSRWVLQYQTALEIRRHLAEHDTDLARGFILPVAVGHYSLGVLTKFTDFNPTLYPDSVGPVVAVVPVPTAASTAAAAAPVKIDTVKAAGAGAGAGAVAGAAVDLTTNEGVLAALSAQPLGEAAAEAALKALGNLCRLDTTSTNANVLVPLGACEVVAAVVKRFLGTSAFVAVQGCYAMHSLALRSADACERLAAAGACELVASVLSQYPTNADVVLHTLWAVANLAGAEERKNRLGAAGAMEAVVAALTQYSTNAGDI